MQNTGSFVHRIWDLLMRIPLDKDRLFIAKGYAFPEYEMVGHLKKKEKPHLGRDLWAIQR